MNKFETEIQKQNTLFCKKNKPHPTNQRQFNISQIKYYGTKLRLLNYYQKSFTLVELLIVIGILAVLTAAVIIVVNPVEYLRQARDAVRVSDLKSMDKALSVLESQGITDFGIAHTVYISIPDISSSCANLSLPALPPGYTYACVTSANLQNVDGTGWIPVNFSQSTTVAFPALPVDPINSTSSNLFYTYIPGGSWELTAAMESSKYQQISLNISNDINPRYQIGSDISLATATVYGGASEPIPPVDPPSVITSAATNIYDTSAIFNGDINPNSDATTYWFEYGPTLSYGSSTTPVSAGSGSATTTANVSQESLVAGNQYYVRLVAQNGGGTTYGQPAAFYTLPSLPWALYLMDSGSGQIVVDQSGHSRNLTLGADTNAGSDDPAWATLNGVSFLQFSGGQFCRLSGFTSIPQPFSIVLMMVRSTAASYQIILSGGGDIGRSVYTTSAGTYLVNRWVNTFGINYSMTGSWDFFSFVANGATSSIQGQKNTPVTGNSGTSSFSSPMYIGSGSGGASSMNGYIAAVAIVSGILNQTDANKWYDYFKAVKGGLN